jgi:UrcA family protein
MSRFKILSTCVLAASVRPLTPAVAQDDYYSSDSGSITVTAPHHRQVGRSALGAPIIESEAAQTVDYSDLDLRTSYDRERLNHRVNVAAYEACAALDDAYGTADPSLSEPRDCYADARARAQRQVREAIDIANYRY